MQARRPKPFKLASGRLLDEVARRLRQLWSPQEIAARLRLDYADAPEMHVSHETIYQSLFVQGRGELRRELSRCLRSGRATRKARGATDGRGRIPGMVHDQRASRRGGRPGGARALGRRSDPRRREAAAPSGRWSSELPATVLLLHLPDGKRAEQVAAAMRETITKLPTAAGANDHLGPGRGDVQARRLHDRDRRSRSTSAIRIHHGSAAATRTPTASCVSTYPRAATSASSPARNSMPSRTASTAGHARRWAI